MKIGVLGSACNPPHNGHIRAALSVKRLLKLDRIIIIPTKVPPHKDRPEVSAPRRLRMARLAVANKHGWSVSDIELRRPGKSYTRDTVAALKKKYPSDEIFWIVGSDSIVSMPWQWRGGYGILDLCTFVVLPRRGSSLARVPRNILKKVVVLPRDKSWDISSTMIRNRIRTGKKVGSFLHPEVLRFIKYHKLYV